MRAAYRGHVGSRADSPNPVAGLASGLSGMRRRELGGVLIVADGLDQQSKALAMPSVAAERLRLSVGVTGVVTTCACSSTG